MYYSDVTFSFGQGFISSNWASGGENSLSILSDIKYFATYKKNNTTWENSIRYRLGALKSGSEDLSKNEDKLELQSKLGIKAFIGNSFIILSAKIPYWLRCASSDIMIISWSGYIGSAFGLLNF